MNSWEVPNYYSIADALDDVVLRFAKQKKAQPTIDELCEVAAPFFDRAGIKIIDGAVKESLDSIRPMMCPRIQKRMNELLEYTDYVI